MGIAVGDYNNDGLVDFFFSNTGSSVPEFLARGDLAEGDIFNKKWILFKNEGNFKFTDAAMETNVADFEFSWGALFQDFNFRWQTRFSSRRKLCRFSTSSVIQIALSVFSSTSQWHFCSSRRPRQER